jgi:hypothetical protein
MNKLRPQPHRLIWPLTPSQVESLDEMLQMLFKQAIREHPTSSLNLAQMAARVSLHV